jgi:hypothetical protein
VVEVGVGQQVGAELPAGELTGEAPAAPAHPGVEDDVAEQVDVEAAAGPAAGQGQAGASSYNGWGCSAVALMRFLQSRTVVSAPASAGRSGVVGRLRHCCLITWSCCGLRFQGDASR